jgi:hypothetical protein
VFPSCHLFDETDNDSTNPLSTFNSFVALDEQGVPRVLYLLSRSRNSDVAIARFVSASLHLKIACEPGASYAREGVIAPGELIRFEWEWRMTGSFPFQLMVVVNSARRFRAILVN